MRSRRGVVWLVVPSLLLSAPAKTSTVEKYVRELAAVFALHDLKEPLRHFCAEYLSRPLGGDSANVRDVVQDLFIPQSDVNGRGARWTRSQVDAAFENGCRRYGRDPKKFLDATSSALALTKAGLVGQIKTACIDLAQRLKGERRYPGLYDHPGHPRLLEVTDEIGISHQRLQTAMAGICRNMGSPISLPPATKKRR